MPNTSGTEENNLNVDLLLSTFLKIEPQSEEFATTFYQVLFERYPNVQPLFSATNMEQQKIKLIQSLQLVIANVHNTEALNDILRALGARHVEYGAVLTDYPAIGDSLLKALEKHLGKDWNGDVLKTWTAAYQMIAQMMTAGANAINKNIGQDVINVETKHNMKNKPANNRTIIYGGTPTSSVFTKLIPLALLSIAAICGGIAWSLMQGQDQPTQNPSPALEQPK
jgi:hemoglobin-like flavoprotein